MRVVFRRGYTIMIWEAISTSAVAARVSKSLLGEYKALEYVESIFWRTCEAIQRRGSPKASMPAQSRLRCASGSFVT